MYPNPDVNHHGTAARMMMMIVTMIMIAIFSAVVRRSNHKINPEEIPMHTDHHNDPIIIIMADQEIHTITADHDAVIIPETIHVMNMIIVHHNEESAWSKRIMSGKNLNTNVVKIQDNSVKDVTTGHNNINMIIVVNFNLICIADARKNKLHGAEKTTTLNSFANVHPNKHHQNHARVVSLVHVVRVVQKENVVKEDQKAMMVLQVHEDKRVILEKQVLLAPQAVLLGLRDKRVILAQVD